MKIELTPAQQQVLHRAVEKYGRRAQLIKCAEELRELALELERAACGEGELFHIVDERADVFIMLHQLDELLITGMRPHVQERVDYKVERLAGRLGDG